MKRTWVRLGGIFLLVFLLALFLRMPAGWLLYWTSTRLPASVECQSVSGTIFNATCNNLAVILPGGRSVYFTKGEWKASLVSILWGRWEMSYRLLINSGEVRGSVKFGINNWKVPETEADLPISYVNTLLPGFDMSGMKGRLLINGKDITSSYDAGFRTGTLNLDIKNFQTDLVDDNPLGDYSITLDVDQGNGGLQGKLQTTTRNSPLQIQGDVRIDSAGKLLRFQGRGKARPGTGDSLRDLMSLMGNVRNDSVDIDWKINL